MYKKIISTLIAALVATASLSTQAAILTYTGEVTGTTGAFTALTPAGTFVTGSVGVLTPALDAGLIGIDDIASINIQLGGFCLTGGGGGCAGVGLPITSIDSAAITGSSGVLGGAFAFTVFSSTFMESISIAFDLDSGTFLADGGFLGTVAGNGTLNAAPVPVPAAVWLFGSALLGMMGVRRRV